jgi:4-amino-4-deoxy-L-arabinose transferase-like glycosyltransferase
MKKPLILLLTIFVFGLFLRLYQLSSTPPALNWDEASLGYNAFSISQTLRDEHGEFMPQARFIAYGDYKPPLYIYVAAVSVKLLGLSEFSTRLPSAIAGSVLIIVTFFLTKELLWWWRQKFPQIVPEVKSALLAAFLVAISPWSLQLSRGAFEGNLATLLSGVAIYFLVRLFRQNSWWLAALVGIFSAASMYTFNSHRVFVPLFLLTVVLVNVKRVLQDKRLLVSVGILFLTLFFLALPMVPHLLSTEGRLRFDEVSWTKDTSIVQTANARITNDKVAGTISFFDNRRFDFANNFLKHLTDHFQANYLFFHGDPNPRLSSQDVGEFYIIESLFLVLGTFFILKHRLFPGIVLTVWVLIGLIPGSLARETPHALRTLNLVPAPQIIAAIGLVALYKQFHKAIITCSVVLLYVTSTFFHSHAYFVHYNQDFASEWQYGYKQMVNYVSSVEKNYDHISVTGKYGRPYIYFLFFNKFSPEKYWQTRQVDRDTFGFWTVNGFAKYSFGDKTLGSGGKNLIVSGEEAVPKGARLLKTIVEPSGKVVFQIYEN